MPWELRSLAGVREGLGVPAEAGALSRALSPHSAIPGPSVFTWLRTQLGPAQVLQRTSLHTVPLLPVALLGSLPGCLTPIPFTFGAAHGFGFCPQ